MSTDLFIAYSELPLRLLIVCREVRKPFDGFGLRHCLKEFAVGFGVFVARLFSQHERLEEVKAIIMV